MTLVDVLGLPAAYRVFNVLIGAPRARTVFVEQHVRPFAGARLLDAGCGPGSMVPHLEGVDYTGFDANERYVAAARALHPRIRFLCHRVGDDVAAGERFDLVVASGLLHHLDDDDVLRLSRLAASRLEPGGRLITIDPCLVAGQHPMARWLARRDRGAHVRSRDQYLELLQRVFDRVTATIRTDLLRVPYTHLITESAQTPASGRSPQPGSL